MARNGNHGAALRITALTAALLGVYGVANAAGLTLADGDSHTEESQTYDFVDVRYGTPKTLLTTLDASHFTINDSRADNNSGAVFAKGGTINISDSEINTTGKRSGVEAFSARGSEAATTIIGDRLTINTTGDSAHGVFLYFERNAGDRSDTNLTINESTITTTGKSANGLIVGGTGNSAVVGNGVLTGNNLDIRTGGSGSTGVTAQYLGKAALNQSLITTTGAGAAGAVAVTGASIDLSDSSISSTVTVPTGTYAVVTGIAAKNSGSLITGNNVEISIMGASEAAWGLSSAVSASDHGVINLTGGSISANGTQFERGILASTSATVETNGVAISTAGEKSNAVHAYSATTVAGTSADTPQIILKNGSVVTTGEDSYGLFAQNNGSVIHASDLSIITDKDDSYGAVAYNAGVVDLTDVDIVTVGTGAYGVSAGSVSTGQAPGTPPNPILASRVDITGGSITTRGHNADGVVVTNASTVILNNSSLTTQGSNAAAASVSSGSTLTATDSMLVSQEGDGIVMTDAATVTLDNTAVAAKNAALVANLKSADATQNVTISNGSTLSVNNGTLLQVTRTEAGTDGVVNLTMSDGAVAVGNIRDEDSKEGGSTHLVLNNAQWTGGLYGVDSFEIRSGASFTETGGQVSTDTLAMDDGVKVAFTNGVTLTNQFVAKGGTKASFSGVSDLQGGVAVDGPSSTFVANGAKISVPGTKDMQKGVSASNGATVNLTDGSVSAKGTTRTRGIFASTGGKITASNVAISTEAAKSHAVHAFVEKDDTAAVPSITVNGGTISTEGNESWGLYALRGGQITSSADVTTKGKAGFGAFVEGNNEANARGGKITLNGGSITTTGQQLDGTEVGSFGVLAKNLGNHVEINGTRITTSGAYADGLRAEDKATIKATNAQITVTGANAHGATLMGGSSLTMTGGGIEASGTGSSGLFIQDQSSATLNGVKVVSAGPSITSSFRAERQQQITVGAASDLTQNNGTLLLVNREIGGEKGTVKLDLQAGSFSAGNVLDQNGTKQVTVNKATDAYWAGIVIDKTTVVVPAGGSQEYTNAPIDGSVASGEGSAVAFNNGADISGSVSSGVDSTTTFNGATSIGGDVAGQHGSSSAFGGATHIGGSVAGASSSTFTFTGPSTDIGGSVAGAAGSIFSFSGPTTIGGNLAGLGSSFSFSQGTPTTIDGDVDLGGGSSIGGGTTGTPIQIGGSAQVGDGSVLGGNLNIAGMVSGSGGTLNPGNSAGVQTYGSLGAFTGTYVAEVNAAGQSDLIKIASGNADLTGIDLQVRQETGNGGYQLNHDYTIVETVKADGISAVADNKFVSEALDESFAGTLVKLDAAKYGANTVKISLSTDTAAVDKLRPGLSANQNATLDGVISVAGVNTSADAALQSTDTKGVLNQLSGELHGSTQASLINASDLTIRTLSNRMRGNLGAGMVAGAPTAQASGSVAGAMPTSAAYPLWAQVVGNWGTLDDDGNAAKAKTQTTGLFIGGDTAFGSGWRVGAALGFTDGEVKVNDRSSKSDVTSYTAAIYGGNSWATAKGNVNLLAGAAYTRHNIDSRRSVSVGGNQTLKADYHANTTQLFTELGYAFPVGQASTVEPYLGVAWISQRAKDFSETGGSAALRGESQNDDVTTMTLGLRGTTMLDVGSNQATLTGGLGWRHAAGDVDTSRRMSFIQGNGAQFTVAGAPIAKNAAVLDLGAEMSVGKSTALGLSYTGQFGDGNTDSTGSLYLKVRFK